MNVFITGATGLIGRALAERLRAAGHTVTPMVRGNPQPGEVRWSAGKPLDPAVLASADAVVHLAGKNVATRWTPAARKEIFESRVAGTKTISDTVAESFRRTGRPTVLLSASAVGYYGSRGDETLTEHTAPGSGFLNEVCVAWEAAAKPAVDAGVRVVYLRTGIVLTAREGALGKMLAIFKWGGGGRLGDGRQWWSWISLEDEIGAILFALENSQVQGPMNLAAPNPVTNAEFTRVLGEVLHRPTLFPVPKFAIHLAMGREAADETALASARVLPARLLQYGYQFVYADLRQALQNSLS